MPRIRFILLRCTHCGAEYKVRLERIETRAPFECLACGTAVAVQKYTPLLEALHRYSEAVLKVEDYGRVEGEVLVLPPGMTTIPSIY